MPKLLTPFPILAEKIINYEQALSHSLEEWENKVDPVLFELARSGGVQNLKFLLGDARIQYAGNDPVFARFLASRGRTSEFPKADLFLYVYSGLTDLAILRRLKEYPDETDRSEIEAPWIAECEEAKSIILINPNV